MNVNYHLNLSPSSLEIIYRSVDGLRPDPANPRCHSKKQVRQIAESIKAFGFNVPILIDRDGNVVAGHGRVAACRELGMTQVPTLCLDHLTPAQLRAFRIADNRLTNIALEMHKRSELSAQILFYSRVPIDSRCRRGGVGGSYVLRRGR